MTPVKERPRPVVLGFPYLVYSHGVRVTPVDDEELRDLHSSRFPITGGQHDGYRLGGRW